MKKIKVVFIIFMLIGIILSATKKVDAHSVELDPESLITMPMLIFGGSGTVIVRDSVSDYTLYFQAIEIPNNVYSEIEQVQDKGLKEIEDLKQEYEELKTEVDNLKTAFNDALEAYKTGITNNVSEAELETLKTTYETARDNYEAKVNEYSDKINEYNNKANEINNKIKDLTPMYIESNWTPTIDNKVSIDLTEFSGDQPYVIWVRLVTSDTTYYDEAIYTITGNKETEVNIESVTLNKTTISIKEGSSYTLSATITPSNATNKSLIWKSDNEKVATVSNGVIKGISEGTATITVTTEDGNYSDTCKVTVTKKETTDSPDEETPDNQKPDTEEPNTDKPNTENPDTEKPNTNKPDKVEDETVASGKLPQTGANMAIVIAGIIIMSLIAIIMYKKYNIYKDIK